MPIVFVHGVNTRDTDPGYKTDMDARAELFERRVLRPLSAEDHRFKGMKIVDAYWGKHGAEFRWGLQSLPPVSTVEHLGESDDVSQADFVFTESIMNMAGPTPAEEADEVEALGELGDRDLCCRAARIDLTTFLEHVLTPVLLSESGITAGIATTPITEGAARAILAIAIVEIGSDVLIRGKVATCVSDAELLVLVRDEVVTRFETLIAREINPGPEEDEVEELGRPAWLDDTVDRARELFARTLGAPGRVATIPLLQLKRESLNRRLVRFLGDVFVYLKERGDEASPGKIILAVREAIEKAPRKSDDEPLIVISHSMGGNIIYDLVTHFNPQLRIDIWVSVAGQVAVFEEMKLFCHSDPQIKAPSKISGLRPQIKYWLNLYDPADPLSFRVAPVFAEVDADLPYLTGSSALKAHGEYFGRATFYDLVRDHIRKALARRPEGCC